MPARNDFTLTAQDDTGLCCYEWPAENARAAVVIVHGLAEHAKRYGRFAQALNAQGIAVVSMDQRGHGATSLEGVKGQFARKGGWKKVLEDIRQLSKWTKDKYEGKPVFLLALSAGTIFARAALSRFGEMYKAALLLGISVDIPVRRNIAPAIAFLCCLLQGRNKPSPILDSLTFGSFNKSFKPARTRFDWLSRDTKEIDKYVMDENCGFIATGSMFYDLSLVLLDTLKESNIVKIPKEVPILLVYGSEDPVGGFGEAASYLAKRYSAAGLDVSAKSYEGARHELLNETNRDEVTKDLVEFINDHI